MDEPGSLKPIVSIRIRLLLLLLGVAALVVVVASVIAVSSTQSQGQIAQDVSSQALREQAEEYLVRLTRSSANENDLILEQLRMNAHNLAAYAAEIFGNPDAFTGDHFWVQEDHMFVGPDGQYMNGESDTSSVFVPVTSQVDEETIRDIEVSAYLDFMFVNLFESNPNIEAIYFATQRDVTRYYPNIGLGSVVPPDFQPTQRPWYTGSTLTNNTEREAWWSPVYVDATGLGLVTTAAAPVYSGEDDLIGVVGIDVTLNEMKASMESTRILETGYSFLIDKDGFSVALPEQGYKDILGRNPGPDEAGADLSGVTTAFGPILASMLNGENGFQSIVVDGEELFVAYAPMRNTGWSLGSVVQSREVLRAVTDLQAEIEHTNRSLVLNRIVPVSLVLFLVVVVVGWVLTNRLVEPIQKLASAAQMIGSGQWDVELPQVRNDEIGVLARAFRSMIGQLQEMVGRLESLVAERTYELSRRTDQLEAAARVAREASAIRDVKPLLNRAVRLISDRFGFYHAGVFLIDDIEEYAILQAASSDGGQRMLERGHKLRVGQTGIVGVVAGTGSPRIALDVGVDAVFFNNPDLPYTRSEMALPLKVRNHVVGVLDVQSTQGAAFNEEDIEILQILADQLALALENARLLEESQRSIQEVSKMYGQQTLRVWEQRSRHRPSTFVYDRLGVESVEPNRLEKEPQKIISEPVILSEDGFQKLVVPISVRGQVLGWVMFRREMDQEPWTEEELTLVQEAINQITPALENARLLEETQYQAAREQTVNIISTEMRGSVSMDAIMQNTVKELGKWLGAARTFIQLGPGFERERPSE